MKLPAKLFWFEFSIPGPERLATVFPGGILEQVKERFAGRRHESIPSHEQE